MRIARSFGIGLCSAALLGAPGPATAQESLPAANDDGWTHIGLLRVRDLTPFGILRLDFLPAHAITARPKTFALEANLSWQNTFVLSDNVADYLERRGGGSRVRLTQEDVDAILALDGDAYFVDLELGLFDLTAHYRFGSHWGGYLTVPVLFLRDGDLDSSIEAFHDEFGFSTAHRDLAVRNDFQVVVETRQGRFAVLEPPEDGVGDPVLGARFSRYAEPTSWNLIGEAAVKLAWRDEQPFLSSGRSDYGVQLSYQRFFEHHALYLTASAVYFSGSSNQVTPNLEEWIPTLVLGWETKLTRNTNVILQLYTSPSVVRDTDLDELSADKYMASLGLQSRRGPWFYRFALTENLQNFSNTPDVGLTFSVARVVFGR
jgi:hypothetical protein